MPRKVPKLWTNWAGNQACAPYAQERPASEADLVQIVKTAAANERRVKVVGAGHSFTGIACTDGHLVDLSSYGRVLSHDAANNTVTMQAGISLSTLCDELAPTAEPDVQSIEPTPVAPTAAPAAPSLPADPPPRT